MPDTRSPTLPETRGRTLGPGLLVVTALLAGLTWSYWPTLRELTAFWSTNQDYSVGQLVPLLVVFLVWRRRRELRGLPLHPGWSGLLVLVAAEALRQAGVYFDVATFERWSLWLAVVGLVVVAGGWTLATRFRWELAFLLLMMPLPGRLHELVAGPLQRLASMLAVAGLELLGIFVSREGNLLTIGAETTIGVTEACSGLRMLTAFVVVSALLAFLVERPAWQRAVLVVSAVPIAVLANAVRAIGIALFARAGFDTDSVDQFHDIAGLAMMPLGLALAFGLLRLLDWLTAAKPFSPRPTPPPGGPATRRRSPAWSGPAVALALTLAGGAAYRVSATAFGAGLGPPLKLDPPLASLPHALAGWIGQDHPVSDAVLRIANNDDYVVRRYLERGTGEAAMLYIGYTAQPRTMLRHRPGVCYPSAGWSIVARRGGVQALSDGRTVPILVHEFRRLTHRDERILVVNFYSLAGELTTDESSFWGLSWRRPGRVEGRYVAQVQVMVESPNGPGPAERVARGFLAAAAPAILKLMPEVGTVAGAGR